MQRPYLNGRLIDDRPEGFVVIVPVESEPPVPLACPLCSFAMRTDDDEGAYTDVGCCFRCALLWAHPRREAWKAGWRPTPEQVLEAEVNRAPLAVVLNVDGSSP